jgi:hypothetical protein
VTLATVEATLAAIDRRKPLPTVEKLYSADQPRDPAGSSSGGQRSSGGAGGGASSGGKDAGGGASSGKGGARGDGGAAARATDERHPSEMRAAASRNDWATRNVDRPLFTDEERAMPVDSVQREGDPKKLFEDAKVAQEQELDLMNHGQGLDKALGAKVIRADRGDNPGQDTGKGPVIVIGPIKKMERADEKITQWYKGDWHKVNDLVRASVAVDKMSDIPKVVQAIRATGVKIVAAPNDRCAKPTPVGYRDIVLRLQYPNGHVGEMQVHLKGMLKAKDIAHKLYAKSRSIEGASVSRALTSAEKKEMANLNAQQWRIYGDAWTKATT